MHFITSAPVHHTLGVKQVDIMIFKNQALQILYFV